MQTFLPYSNFYQSAKCLDNRRLGKQRVEAMQILQALLPDSISRWKNHPAVKMWKNHEEFLACYGIIICKVWKSKGYKDTCEEKIAILASKFEPSTRPNWLGNKKFHMSHQSNLLRKNREHYIKFFNVKDDLEYVWPE